MKREIGYSSLSDDTPFLEPKPRRKGWIQKFTSRMQSTQCETVSSRLAGMRGGLDAGEKAGEQPGGSARTAESLTPPSVPLNQIAVP
jgi:hypothetical protein